MSPPAGRPPGAAGVAPYGCTRARLIGLGRSVVQVLAPLSARRLIHCGILEQALEPRRELLESKFEMPACMPFRPSASVLLACTPIGMRDAFELFAKEQGSRSRRSLLP